MKIIRSISLIINYKTFVVTLLAVASTWVCEYVSLKADFPLTLIGIAIVFPVVFSIDSAYKRRERALSLLGDFKAHLIAIYYASRDWVEPVNPELQLKLKSNLHDLFLSLKTYCTTDHAPTEEMENITFEKVSEVSKTVQSFRKLGMYLGEVSRINQYVSKAVIDIENIKVIAGYRTPVTLRAYSKVFIYSFPILYGPYFVHVSQNFSIGLGYMLPIVFSFILVSLDNIQGHLENPFDQIGEDDVKFDVEEFTKHMN